MTETRIKSNGHLPPVADLSPSSHAFRTRSAHTGDEPDRPARPFAQPIFQGSVYAFDDAELADDAFALASPLYARDGLPNARSLERAIADLEGVEAAQATSSGMSAIALAFLSLASSGDRVVAQMGCYADTAVLLGEVLARFGIEVEFVDFDDLDALRAAVSAGARIVYAETISNPEMQLADLPAIATIAHAAGALFLVDNTLATPALCRPFEHGADLVLHSAGKFLGGHHDVSAGIVAGQAALIARLRRMAYLTGPVLAPLDAWLTLRGMKTLAPRIAWSSQSAGYVAAFLAAHPAVAAVRYPGWPRPDRSRLTEQLLPYGAGGLLAFDLTGGPAAASEMIARLKLIAYVPSLGGPTTIVSYPPPAHACDLAEDGATERRPYKSETVRLSIGLEDPDDIIADLRQALDAAMLA